MIYQRAQKRNRMKQRSNIWQIFFKYKIIRQLSIFYILSSMDNNEKINFELESENLDGKSYFIQNNLTMSAPN